MQPPDDKNVERVNHLLTESDTSFANLVGASMTKTLNQAMRYMGDKLNISVDRQQAIILLVVNNVRRNTYTSFGVVMVVENALDFDGGLDEMLKTLPPPATGENNAR